VVGSRWDIGHQNGSLINALSCQYVVVGPCRI
jgi:hypothetical protein